MRSIWRQSSMRSSITKPGLNAGQHRPTMLEEDRVLRAPACSRLNGYSGHGARHLRRIRRCHTATRSPLRWHPGCKGSRVDRITKGLLTPGVPGRTHGWPVPLRRQLQTPPDLECGTTSTLCCRSIGLQAPQVPPPPPPPGPDATGPAPTAPVVARRCPLRQEGVTYEVPRDAVMRQWIPSAGVGARTLVEFVRGLARHSMAIPAGTGPGSHPST